MANTENAVKALLVLTIGVGATALVAGTDLPGTNGINIGGDDEPRYVLTADVGVGSAELKQDKIKIKEKSFRYDVDRQTLVSPLSITSPGGALSYLEAEGVEMKYTLNGPIERPIEKTDNIGSVGSISASKLSTFKAGNLPCGSYVLHMNLNWNSGSDYYKQPIDISCRGDTQ